MTGFMGLVILGLRGASHLPKDPRKGRVEV